MYLGHITDHIDLPQAAVTLFFIFFVLLVWHLRRADKREGYPMQAPPFDRTPLLGFPAPPEMPAEYELLEGGTTLAPHAYPQPKLHARPLYKFAGTPLVPVGNPLLAAIGPGAWVNRRDEPMVTERHNLMLQPLRLLHDWSLAPGETDPRGMIVFDWRWLEIGVVRDVWIDRSIEIIRMLEIELRPGLGRTHILAPIYHTDIRERAREVRIESLRAHQFADVPMPAAPERITAREDDRLNAYYAAGRFYRDTSMTDPPEAQP